MARANMNEMLRKRMSATQQASEQQTGDAAYEQIFQMPVPQTETQFRDVPVCKLHPFYTADIGFHPYPHAKLEAFAEELKENGLYERILVRPIAGTDEFEILAGHNRTAAAKLAGWTDIPATVMNVNDQRAISIAIATNLLRRQDLTIIERGKAYKALLDARNRCGQRNAAVETFGDNRQRYNARKIVAEFFGVTEYEIRKAVKLAQLIPSLAEIVEDEPKKLNLACADLIADYDESAQTAFIEMCQIDGYALNKQTMAFIPSLCSRQRAFQQAEIPRLRSRTMCPHSKPAAARRNLARPVQTAVLPIGNAPHPQRRYLRQRRLPTTKLVRPHVRPRGLMRHVRQNSALRSAQFPHKAAAQKSHRKLLRIRLPLLPNGRAGNRLPQLLWAA